MRELAGSRPISELFSWKSPTAKSMGVEPGKLSDDRLLELMEQNPTLIRRPIIVKDGKLQIGYSKQGLEV